MLAGGALFAQTAIPSGAADFLQGQCLSMRIRAVPALLSRLSGRICAGDGPDIIPIFRKSVTNTDDVSIMLCLIPLYLCNIGRINKLKVMKKLFLIPLLLLAGKQTALFASSGSSLISTSERDAASLVPDATFEESLLLTSSTLDDMDSRIPAWLEGLSQGTENINIRFERQ